MDSQVRLFNTLGRRRMPLEPVEPGVVRLYTCGPTVYNYAHIGNLRTYIFEDLLRRSLEYLGYQVRHVMNVTDVGHLTSDADTGEDKMLVGARRERKTVWEIARFYEQAFYDDLQALNIQAPHVRARATEHIPEMIALIERIQANGFAYQAGGNVYFSVDRFPHYGELAGLSLDGQQAGARVKVDPHKRNPFDFVLWFTESKFPDQVMKWDSPWGVGFPGWHIECTAMAIKYLGERVDIHCGGVDHIAVHHTNEIAQGEAALGHPWVTIWLHGEFLILKKDRMSKSSGQFLTLAELRRQGFAPLEYRYFCLGAHYRSKLQFDWQALEGARNALENLRARFLTWQEDPDAAGEPEPYRQAFAQALADDLDLPQALAVTWQLAKDASLGAAHKRTLLLEFDRVLGLEVASWPDRRLSPDLQALIDQREAARQRGDYEAADGLREALLAAGVAVQDTPAGPRWYLTRKAG